MLLYSRCVLINAVFFGKNVINKICMDIFNLGEFMEEKIYEEWNGFCGEDWKESIDVSSYTTLDNK